MMSVLVAGVMLVPAANIVGMGMRVLVHLPYSTSRTRPTQLLVQRPCWMVDNTQW
jgi:hypothetical protein